MSFRRCGSVAYGFGLFNPEVTPEQFATRFHGNNERVDTESLKLSAMMWEALCRDFLG